MKPKTTFAALLAVALLAAGCGRSGGGGEEGTEAGQAVTGDFGDLKGICKPGGATGSPAQGVTKDAIEVGVFTDVGFTKNSEYLDTAKAFTSWCNAAGGINGRKLVANIRDTKMVEVRQRMLESCKEDFVMAGGSAALDALGVKDRLSCLLPAFPAQATQVQSNGSDLQLSTWSGISYHRYAGYYRWLMKEAHPQSLHKVGFISGDSPVVKVLAAQYQEGVKFTGGTTIYNDYYPSTGVSDWTPYAQSLKSKGVKGLVFLGDFTSLAKLMNVLQTLDYKLDWIDANNNAYGPTFVKLAGKSLDFHNTYADLQGVHPLENASSNPATQQVVDMFKKYAPDSRGVTLPALRAWSSWLLFAKAASSCGDEVTRKCVYEAATKETAWTGGGLLAPVDASKQDALAPCFNIVKATPEGWRVADFKPDKGAYRCDQPSFKYTGDYGRPLRLADVGKSLGDLK